MFSIIPKTVIFAAKYCATKTGIFRDFRDQGSDPGTAVLKIKARVLAARQTFGMLVRPLHGRAAVAVKTKLAVFRAVTLAQLLYAAETWTLENPNGSGSECSRTNVCGE